jgi:hypothetical protein
MTEKELRAAGMLGQLAGLRLPNFICYKCMCGAFVEYPEVITKETGIRVTVYCHGATEEYTVKQEDLGICVSKPLFAFKPASNGVAI